MIAPGEVTVKPLNEYNVIAVINATIPHERKTNGNDITMLRLFWVPSEAGWQAAESNSPKA